MKTENACFVSEIVSSIAVISLLALSTQAQPTITQQPTNQIVLLGGAASFTVAATGTPSISYAWQFDGTNNNQGGQTLTIPVVHHADLGSYDVVVTDQTGSVTSSVVVLRLTNARPVITLVTNAPSFNVVSMQFTTAPGVDFQLLVTHDLTSPIQWSGPTWIAPSGGSSNYNWSYSKATNYTKFYPRSFWMLDPYP